jgi:hypothetical protein
MRSVIEVVSSPNWLVSVSVCEGLVLPTVTLPKLSNGGFSSSLPVSLPLLSANARLGAAKPITRRSAKLKTENVKIDDFGRDMFNPRTNTAVTNVCESPHLTSRSSAPEKICGS